MMPELFLIFETHIEKGCIRQISFIFVSLCLLFTTLSLSSAKVNASEETDSRTGRSILMYLPMSWGSHQNVFMSFSNALAERGHNVTMVLPASAQQHLTKTSENDGILTTDGAVEVIWIKFSDSIPAVISNSSQGTGGSESSRLFRDLVTNYGRFKAVSNNIRACHMAALMHSEIREILNRGRKSFDLVIVAGLFNEIGYFLAHKLNVPLILLMPANAPQVLTNAMGYFDNPTFVPSVLNNKGQYEMPNFLSRLTSFIVFNAFGTVKRLIWINIQDEVLRELHYVDDDSSVDLLQLERNASFGMYFTHYIFDAVRPTLPNTIDIGFIHCRPPKTLQTDLSSWFDEEEKKVIYIAFGSIVNFDKIIESVQKAIIGTFADTRYRFLLKSSAYISDLANVRTCHWCPQQDILGHPKTVLFISHGGFMSLQEAIYHGVPVLLLPFFGFDGLSNARRAERQGYGLDSNASLDLSPDEMRNCLLHRIDTMLDNNANYTLRAKHLGNLVRDDIRTPAEKAVFWSEYVIRHAGADHIKSPSRNMHFFYFFHVDIFLCFAVVFCLLVCFSYHVTRIMLKVAWSITLKTISVAKGEKRHLKKD